MTIKVTHKRLEQQNIMHYNGNIEKIKDVSSILRNYNGYHFILHE